MFPGLIEGRIVHYVLDSTDPVHKSAVGQHRPAIVVNSWPGLGRDDGYSNLLVFVDGSNDATQFIAHADSPGGQREIPRFMFWATSRVQSVVKAPRTWHMIERTDEKPAAPTSHNSTSNEVAKQEVATKPAAADDVKAAERMEGEGGTNGGK